MYLEAALHGVPAVAYDSGGVREAVLSGITGLLAPEGDTAALTAHLTTLLTDPGLAARLGRAGRARIVRDFDVVAQTAELERIYDRVAGLRSGR